MTQTKVDIKNHRGFFPLVPREKLERFRDVTYVGTMIYGTMDIVALTGVTQRQLEYWVDKDVIKPEHPANGQGTRKFFTHKNLVQILIANNLKGSGVSLESIRNVLFLLDHDKYFRNLHLHDREDEPVALLVLDRDRVEIRKEVRLEELSNGHQCLTYINLVRIEKCVAEIARQKSQNA